MLSDSAGLLFAGNSYPLGPVLEMAHEYETATAPEAVEL